jgi:hypothetical protein
MRPKREIKHPSITAIQLCTLLIVIFVLFVFLLPVKPEEIFSYHFSKLQYRLVLLIVSIPSLLVWIVAFWGYSQLKIYSAALKKTSEGRAFNKIASGLMWLAWSLPLSSILNRLLSVADGSKSTGHHAVIILFNYIDLILPLVAFIYLYQGVKLIVVNRRRSQNEIPNVITAFFVLFGIAYCYLTLKTFDLSSLGSSHNPYHLPAWLMIITIIIPYLYAWFIGMVAAIKLNSYSIGTQGVIYKKALKLLSIGLTTIIIGFVAVQYTSTARPTYGRLVLSVHMVLSILFRIIVGIGFITLSYGVNRLKKIEQV